MRIIYCENYLEFSKRAADFAASQIMLRPDSVLALPTGSTPVGMYRELVGKDLDWSEITSFNLDEYAGIRPDNPQSYFFYMNQNLFSHVNLKAENIHIPDGIAEDLAGMARQYDEDIRARGGIDLAILGIGNNGHIGFNEPGNVLDIRTHVVNLTDETIRANARFFSSPEEVPAQAITMGVGSILKAKRILLLVSGSGKEAALSQLLLGKVTTENPASLLLLHPDVTVLVDQESVHLDQ